MTTQIITRWSAQYPDPTYHYTNVVEMGGIRIVQDWYGTDGTMPDQAITPAQICVEYSSHYAEEHSMEITREEAIQAIRIMASHYAITADEII